MSEPRSSHTHQWQTGGRAQTRGGTLERSTVHCLACSPALHRTRTVPLPILGSRRSLDALFADEHVIWVSSCRLSRALHLHSCSSHSPAHPLRFHPSNFHGRSRESSRTRSCPRNHPPSRTRISVGNAAPHSPCSHGRSGERQPGWRGAFRPDGAISHAAEGASSFEVDSISRVYR